MIVGTHLIADLHGAEGLDDPARIEAALRGCVHAVGATLIDLRLHHFGPGHGVTGVALLAESHVSIHSWPEHGYAAVDIFLCGDGARLPAAIEVLRAMLTPVRITQRTIARGPEPLP